MNIRLVNPKYWPAWAVIGTLKIIVHLPIYVQFKIANILGDLIRLIGGRRVRIANQNLRLCFPDISDSEHTALLIRVFRSFGMTIVETAYTWLRSTIDISQRFDISGEELLRAAIDEGRGVLLVGAHFGVLDIAGAILADKYDYDCIYRKSRNPVVEFLSLKKRSKLYGNVIDRSDMRKTVRLLQQGRMIWYAADQDNGRKHSVFAPFFGIPAATLNITSRLARINDSPVVFMSHFRDEKSRRWSINLKRISAYPTSSDIKDAELMNKIIEGEIRKHPEQYLWLHRRFKTMPKGENRTYL